MEMQTAINRILIGSDVLMTSEPEQARNRRWLYDLLSLPLSMAADVPVCACFSSEVSSDFLSREAFFKRSQISFDPNAPQFWFDLDSITQDSVNYLSAYFRTTDLFIGYELSDQTRALFDRIGLAWIDLWLHPVRFLDDILFGFNASSQEVYEAMSPFHIKEDTFALYANRLRIQNYRGFLRKNYPILDGAALFIGQTVMDKAVCDHGKMLSVLDYKEEFEEAGRRYGHVYYSRHPYVNDTDQEIMEYVRACPFAEVTDIPAYALLASDHIRHVFGISSSILHEAKYFKCEPHFLYKPCFQYGSQFGKDYLSVYQEFVSPHFWAQALAPLMPVKPCERVMYLDKKDKLRDMLGFYWSYNHIDKNEATRRSCWFLGKRVAKIEEKEVQVKPEEEQAQPLTEEEKFKQIFEQYDVISFDLFDTLIERPYDHPHVLFNYMTEAVQEITGDEELDFKNERERVRELTCPKEGTEEIPLLQRYEALGKKLGWPPEMAKKLSELEEEKELEFCKPTLLGKRLFNVARAMGKKVVVTTDTYFTHALIENLLKKAGYEAYDDLFVSVTEGKMKWSGQLYPVLVERLGVSSDRICHVGDHTISDVDRAHEAGCGAVHYKATNHLFYKPSRFASFYQKGDTLLSSVIRRQVAIKWQPASYTLSSKSITNGSLDFLAYGVLAPFFFGFAKWLLESAIRDNVDVLYFLSRDGRIVKKCYDVLAAYYPKAPKSKYVYASRRALSVSSIQNIDDIKRNLKVAFHSTQLGVVLSHRLGVEDVSIKLLNKHGFSGLDDVVSHNRFLNSITDLALDLAPDIIAQAAKERDSLLSYYKEQGLMEAGKKAIVDIGHKGSLQAAISQLTDNRELGGYYFATHYDFDKSLSHAAYVYSDLEKETKGHEPHPYQKHLLMFELLFLNNHGSFKNIDDKNPCFFPSSQTDEQRAFVQVVHEQAVQFSKDISSFMKGALCGAAWSGNDAILPYVELLESPSVADARLFLGLQFERSYNGTEGCPVLHYNPEDSAETIRESMWQEGARVLASVPLKDRA